MKDHGGRAWLLRGLVRAHFLLKGRKDDSLTKRFVRQPAAGSHVFKLLFSRERLDWTRVRGPREGIPQSGEAFDSFPSGHAVHVGALAGSLTAMIPRHALPIWSAAIALAGTRALLLAHYLTGVVAGLAFGLAIHSGVARISNLTGDPCQESAGGGRALR